MFNLSKLSLNARFTIGLAVIIALITGGVTFLAVKTAGMAHDGEVINLSGRQRMLSQRVVLLAHLISQPNLSKAETNLYRERGLAAVNLFVTSHKKLEGYITRGTHNHQLHREVTNLYSGNDNVGGKRGLTESAMVFANHHRQLFQETYQTKHERYFTPWELGKTEQLLAMLDEAVDLFEMDANLYASDLRQLILFITFGTILVVFLDWLLIFRPTAIKATREQANLQKLHDSAQQEKQAKSDLLALMSHEIRTPLNGIMGMSEMLKGALGDLEQQEQASTIYHSANNLLDLLNAILDFSRLEAGRMTLERLPIDLHSLLDDVAQTSSRQRTTKPVHLIIDISPDCPSDILGDEVRIKQVITNLVTNAFKFTQDGHITIRVESSSQSSLIFSVSDTGKGIAEEQLPFLFDRFRQEDATTARRFGGSGLGLTICKQLVNLMGGEIGVTSKLGEGSRFWFTLPYSPAHLITTQPYQQANPEKLLGKRVWVVAPSMETIKPIFQWFSYWGVDGTTFYSWEVFQQGITSGNHKVDNTDTIIICLPPKPDSSLLDTILRTCQPFSHKTVLASQATLPIKIEPLINHGILGTMAMPFFPLDMFALLAESNDSRESQFFYRHQWVLRSKASGPTPATEKDSPRSLQSTLSTNPLEAPSVTYNHAQPTGGLESGHIIDLNNSNADEQKKLPKVANKGLGHILVVEDNITNQHVIRQFLKKLNYTFDLTEDGETAIQLHHSNTYDLILMDCQLPGIDGFEATYRIRASELASAKHIPIIALTAHRDQETKSSCLAKGMDDFLSKPLSLAALEKILAQWVKQPAKQQA